MYYSVFPLFTFREFSKFSILVWEHNSWKHHPTKRSGIRKLGKMPINSAKIVILHNIMSIESKKVIY